MARSCTWLRGYLSTGNCTLYCLIDSRLRGLKQDRIYIYIYIYTHTCYMYMIDNRDSLLLVHQVKLTQSFGMSNEARLLPPQL